MHLDQFYNNCDTSGLISFVFNNNMAGQLDFMMIIIKLSKSICSQVIKLHLTVNHCVTPLVHFLCTFLFWPNSTRWWKRNIFKKFYFLCQGWCQSADAVLESLIVPTVVGTGVHGLNYSAISWRTQERGHMCAMPVGGASTGSSTSRPIVPLCTNLLTDRLHLLIDGASWSICYKSSEWRVDGTS